MGFATEASAQSSSTIVVRARGTAGSESITLRVNNTNVATWTLTTSLQNYTASTTLTGNVTVAFTNDATGRDVQVDYIIVNGTTRQSENQTSNTGVYANGSCGGGSNSEWLHCNGAIAYGALSSCRQQHRRSCTGHGRHRVGQLARQQHQCGDLDNDHGTPELHRIDEPHRRHHRRVHQ